MFLGGAQILLRIRRVSHQADPAGEQFLHQKGIDNPTTERLLQTFREITLTIVNLPGHRLTWMASLSFRRSNCARRF